jgi:hypothetical protein
MDKEPALVVCFSEECVDALLKAPCLLCIAFIDPYCRRDSHRRPSRPNNEVWYWQWRSEADRFSRRGGTYRLHAIHMNQRYSYGEAGEIVKHAAVKIAKAELQATGLCQWLFSRPSTSLRDQSESEDSRSCASTTACSVVAARVPAGSCSTVARWPAHKRVTRNTCPSGNSSAS